MIDDDGTMANRFYIYFTNIPQKLAWNISASPDSYNDNLLY